MHLCIDLQSSDACPARQQAYAQVHVTCTCNVYMLHACTCTHLRIHAHVHTYAYMYMYEHARVPEYTLHMNWQTCLFQVHVVVLEREQINVSDHQKPYHYPTPQSNSHQHYTTPTLHPAQHYTRHSSLPSTTPRPTSQPAQHIHSTLFFTNGCHRRWCWGNRTAFFYGMMKVNLAMPSLPPFPSSHHSAAASCSIHWHLSLHLLHTAPHSIDTISTQWQKVN